MLRRNSKKLLKITLFPKIPTSCNLYIIFLLPREFCLLQMITIDKLYIRIYNALMIRVTFTNVFEKWVNKLKDRRARAIINQHLDRIVEGNLGNTSFVGESIFEKKSIMPAATVFTIFCMAKIGLFYFAVETNLPNKKILKRLKKSRKG